MEMDRRSIDRSREPGLKKPRLADDVERDRPTSNGVRPRAPPTASGGASSLASRPQQSQQQQTQQNHQELVSQYKTALAELTFNSKPIITNLTIIAGENLHAAKWIAAAVCANIIEVPSDQKLPSLYLLDSIVKNIGRDYIKHFAGRLPEVFCKAYRQVDSAVHPGMRHLFGTWKGVFPPACLQMIEKELGISPPVNGASSAAATTKSESQSQRPPHSIHVNPKYLEARHRLQQPNKAKGSNASTTAMVSPPKGVERPERSAATGGERTWADLPIKIHDFKNHQREVSSEPVTEKNSSGYDDYEYSSDHSRNSDLGHGRAVERVTERDKHDKPWYGVQKKAVETVVAQRNAFDSQHEISNYRASRPALPASVQPTGSTQRSASGGRGTNKNWKNSEEEEYMWDDINSRLTNRQGVDSSRKDVWTPDEAEKLEFDDHLHQPSVELDIGSRVDREGSIDSLRGTAFEHLDQSMWPLRQDTPTRDGLKDTGITSRVLAQPEGPSASVSNSLASTRNNSMARTGLQLTGLLSSSGTLGQQRHQHLRPTSPSRQSSFPLRPHSPSSSAFRQHPENMLEEDHLHIRSNPHFGPKTSQYVPQLTRSPQNSFPIIPQNPVQSSQHLQTSSLNHFTQRRHHSPFPLQSLPELPPVQKPGLKTEAPSAKGHPSSGHTTDSADVQGQSSASSLLAAIVQSGFLSNNSVSAGFPNLNFQDSGALALLSHNHPPLPSGPPPTQVAASSAPIGTAASVLEPASRASTFSHTASSQRKPPIPPLPPGPPPSSVVGTSQTSNVASGGPNQLSGLLSSLVAKGLISTPPKELPSIHSSQVTSHLKNQSLGSTNSSIPVSSYSTPSAILKPSSGNEPPLLESAAKSISALSVPAARSEGTDLIGVQFKPEIIRRSHPLVISALFDDLPYQCDICGFRLKLKEQLDQHLEWHVSKKHETSSRVSRKWFTSSSDWLAGNVISSSRSVSSAGRLVEAAEQKEPVVPADESQCVCLLCGELFEDFYCLERNEWMYKGAVYLPIPATGGGDLLATVDGSSQGPIVHANCISASSIYDMGLAVDVKQGTV